MARKKSGFFGSLWRAVTWAVSWSLRLFYLAARLLFRWFSSVLGFVGRKAENAKRLASRPSSLSTDIPFGLLSSRKGNLAAFEEKLYSNKSTIGLVLGSRGSGKSALGLRLLENIAAKKKRSVYAMGFDEATLPAWIFCSKELGSLPNGAFVLVDEGGIAFSSRQSMSGANKLLSSLILIARHKDISVLFISQNSANLEINAIRQADYLLLRKPSLLQIDFERKKIGEIYGRIAGGFDQLPEEGKHSTYIYSDEFEGYVSNKLPSFWSQAVSKSFASFKAKGRGQKRRE